MSNEKDEQTQRWAAALDSMGEFSSASNAERSENSAESAINQDEPAHSAHIDTQVERVDMPAPSLDALVPRRKQANFDNQRLEKSLAYRRTLVPILLTLGVLFPMLDLLWHQVDEDSPFKKLNPLIPSALLWIGLVFLALGILNVLQLQSMLSGKTGRGR